MGKIASITIPVSDPSFVAHSLRGPVASHTGRDFHHLGNFYQAYIPKKLFKIKEIENLTARNAKKIQRKGRKAGCLPLRPLR